MKISIVIPVYNTPTDYLKRCLDSIIQQKNSDYEIIIINDGSKPELTKEYGELLCNYTNCMMYTKINAGVSAARNDGITMASGDYITFIDADDTISPVFFQEAAAYAVKYQADLVIGRISYIQEIDIPQGNDTPVYLEERQLTKLKCAFLGLPQNVFKNRILGTPCGRLYKTKYVKSVLFPEKISHWEDQIFNRKIFSVVRSAVVVPECWYQYYQNDFSAMHNQLNANYIEKAKPFWKEWDLLNRQETNPMIRRGVCQNSIDFFCSAISLNLLNMNVPMAEKQRIMREMRDEPIFQDMINTVKYSDISTFHDRLRFLLIKKGYLKILYCLIRLKSLLSGKGNYEENS